MRFVPTRLHGAVDYAWGAALLLLPRSLGLPARSAAARSCRVAGAGAIAYAALTDYELGLVPALSMREHLALDIAGGAALAASPWLLGFAHRVRGPHLAFGLFAVAAGLVTRTRPGRGAVFGRAPAVTGAAARRGARAARRVRQAAARGVIAAGRGGDARQAAAA
jgi:hypothetical protein